MKKMTICFDIDNVICKTSKKNNYKNSKPIIKNIKMINNLYYKDYKIIIFTARGMGRYKENLQLIKKKIKPLTIYQLKKWGVRYHKVYFGKPSYDLFIDDKSLFFKENWSINLKKKLV
jgi:capsule biosynthesis phosphatase